MRRQEAIKKGEVLFKVPVRSLLCPAYKTTVVGKHGILPKKLLRRDPWTALILALMAEHSAGAASAWAPFIAVLPQPGSGERESVASPLYWSEAELAELKGTETMDQLGKDEIRRGFEESALPVLRAHFELFSGCAASAEDTEGLFAAYMHWGSVVMCRGFNCHPTYEGPVMTPMADMLNHRTGLCNAHLMDPDEDCDDSSSDGSGGGGNDDDEKLPMVALSDVPCGGELINTYGDRSNGELLRRYGFTDEVNPYDCVYVPWQLVEEHGERVRRMVASGDVPEDGFLLEASAEGKLPRELRRAAHVCALSDEEYKKARKRVSVKAPLEAKMSAAEWRVVRGAVEARLAKYPTTLAQDKATLEANRPTLSLNMLNALRVRIGEKAILEKVLEKCCKAEEKLLSTTASAADN